MIYSEFPPRPSLQPYVRRLMQADSDVPVDTTVRPGPTGFNYLGWIYGGEVSAIIDGASTPAFRGGLHIAGQIRFQDIVVRYQGPLGHVLAEFTATGFYELLPLAGSDFVGAAVPLDPDQHAWAAGFEPPAGRIGPGDARAHLEDLLEALTPHARPVPDYIRHAAAIIEARGGLVSVAALGKELSVSPRQLRRMFQKTTGVTPKYFARIMQFNAAMAALLHDDDLYLTALSHELGYFDQPHFNRSIRQFLHASPQAFLDADREALAMFLGRGARTPSSEP